MDKEATFVWDILADKILNLSQLVLCAVTSLSFMISFLDGGAIFLSCAVPVVLLSNAGEGTGKQIKVIYQFLATSSKVMQNANNSLVIEFILTVFRPVNNRFSGGKQKISENRKKNFSNLH